MKAVIQRVSHASVRVEGHTVSEIGRGMLVLLGITTEDTEQMIPILADKVRKMRFFDDADHKMNLSLGDVNGEMMVVSQFTLMADCRKGNRPSFMDAAPPEKADDYYQKFIRYLRDCGVSVQTGVFQAMMEVDLVNDGPVTILLDTDILIRPCHK